MPVPAFTFADAVVNISGSTLGLNKALGDAERKTKRSIGNITASISKIGRGMLIAGGTIVGGMAVAVKSFAKAGDEVQKMAQRTGFSTEALSELRHAADLSGTSITRFETGIKRMQRAITEAGEEQRKAGEKTTDNTNKLDALSRKIVIAETKYRELVKTGKASNSQMLSAKDRIIGLREKFVALTEEQGKAKMATGTYIEALAMLGVSFEDLEGMTPEAQFLLLTERLADVDDKTRQAAIAQEIFGRAGTEMLPMLTEGSEGLKKMREEAHELGIVFDQEAANQAAEFQDTLTRLKGALQGVGFAIAKAVLPHIENFAKWMVENLPKVRDWVKDNEGVVKTIAKIGAGLAVGGPLLIGLSMFANSIATIIKLLGFGASPVAGSLALALVGIAALMETISTKGETNFLVRFIDRWDAAREAIDKVFDSLVRLKNFLTSPIVKNARLGDSALELIDSGQVTAPGDLARMGLPGGNALAPTASGAGGNTSNQTTNNSNSFAFNVTTGDPEGFARDFARILRRRKL